MKLNRIMIAAPKSGSGKTTITCALLQALKDAGQAVAAYKCGPDYIDPMFHQQVIGIPSKNLDTFFTDAEETRNLFLKDRKEGDFAILEGVMGLFDGLGGVREEGSSYHLAKVTRTPIVLVVDAKGMGRSVIPVLAGFLAYDKEGLIKGVILNRMSKACYEIMKPLIEEELQLCVVGYFPDCKQFHIGSRHLGLLMPNEIEDMKGQLKQVSEEFERTVSIDQIVQIAACAEEVSQGSALWCMEGGGYEEKSGPVIAVAQDEAFCFLYEDNLRLLEEKGARLEYFSPLHDAELPKKSSGLLLGGGYPELHAEELSQNIRMRLAVKMAMKNKMPMVAECGGFMYLHSVLACQEGKQYFMAGVLDKKCHDTGKLVRFGYVELREKKSNFLPSGERIRGHEFHYFDSQDNGSDCIAIKPVSGKSYPCVIAGENYWMGFPHLYYPSNPAFADRFVEKARKYMERRGW